MTCVAPTIESGVGVCAAVGQYRWTYGEWEGEGRQTCGRGVTTAGKNKRLNQTNEFCLDRAFANEQLVRYFENPRIECVTNENKNEHLIR